MASALALSIGGTLYGIDGPLGWLERLAPLYADFTAAGRPAWQISLGQDPALEVTDAPWIRHEGPLTRFRIDCYAGWFDLAARRAEVRAPSLALAAPGLERTVAWACMQELPRQGRGLLLHAAGIIFDGRGLVVSGHSGAGKTTVSRLAGGFGQVLNDEMVIVDLAGPEAVLHSTPFVGRKTPPELVRRQRQETPVHALLLLEHSPDFELLPLSPAEATLRLLETDIAAVERVTSAEAWMAMVDRLVARVPAFCLRFRPTVELWPFLAAELPR